MNRFSNNKIYKKVVLISAIFPLISSAQGLSEFLTSFSALPRRFVPIIFVLAVIYFFWGGAQFVLNAGDEKYREDGKKKMLWGFIALFIFATLGGILNAISEIIGI